jgi:hypothetical protein
MHEVHYRGEIGLSLCKIPKASAKPSLRIVIGWFDRLRKRR